MSPRIRSHLDEIWNGTFKETPIVDTSVPKTCPLATDFEAWCQKLIAQSATATKPLQVHFYEWQLLRKFFEFNTAAPPSCRDQGKTTDHRCLYHILCETFSTLQRTALRLEPIPLPDTAPVAPRPKPADHFVILGEVEDEPTT